MRQPGLTNRQAGEEGGVKSHSLELARRAARLEDPEGALQAVAALRPHLDTLEEQHVENALRTGSSWSDVARLLGVSRQAVHKRYAARLRSHVSSKPRKTQALDQVRETIYVSRQEAAAMEHASVGPEHLLLALLRDDRGPAVRALEAAGLSYSAARRHVRRLYGQPDLDGEGLASADLPPVSARTLEVLQQAVREASDRGDRTLGVEHVLLGLLRDSQGCAAGVLGALGVVPIDVEEAVEAALAHQRLAAD
jgi:ATP-dependent Clp protease ATP-binding subunit ClpA